MTGTLELVLLYLIAAVAGVTACRWLRLPPMLGYLVVGVVIGPHAFALAQDSPSVRYLAEFGVVFLMFVIGLEFNLPKLRSMRALVFGLGLSQVVVTMLAALAGHALLVTGAGAPAWLAGSGLALDRDGFVRVAQNLQSVSHPTVFAAGDVAAYAHPRPKSGVFAVRAGPPLADNLRRAANGEALSEWQPQKRALYLVATGGRHALGAWGPFGWWGGWVWHWKDRIDRAFMRRFGNAHVG